MAVVFSSARAVCFILMTEPSKLAKVAIGRRDAIYSTGIVFKQYEVNSTGTTLQASVFWLFTYFLFHVIYM